MDRGVKIAIFVASIAALCLGLIWDQVLSHARVMVEEQSDDVLAAERIDASIGSPDIERAFPPAEDAHPFEVQPVDEPEVPEPAQPPASAWTEYTVQNGDSYWKLAHVTFKDRGLGSDDIKRCNNGKELRPGDKFMVPPTKDVLSSGAPAREQVPATNAAPSGSASATEYVVKDGDSWWKIAYVHFKDRGLSSSALEAANPGVKLVAGAKIKIP